MATAREDDNPYNGLGVGGKFRKKPYRRVHSTPYDRPPTAIRNPSIVGGGAGGAYNGWLRKIVDPAQKLVMSTAHRLFSSVFTKRLTHTPPPPPPLTPQPPVSPEEQGREKQKEALSMDIIEEQETTTKRGQNPEDGCVKDLEKILKQKTFTTSEVDHLTALLRERAIDKPVEQEHRASKPVSFHEQREELTNTMVPYHDTESFRISSKPTNSAVFTEDVGSPTELAKAYMGSRPSKVSPSVLGLRNQAIAEDSTALTSLPHLSKSPILSIVPRPSAHVGSRENGYATPRPRGRSAIYSMARSPYSRGHLTLTPKSSRPLADGLDGSSPATQPWGGSGSSASKALKRSSSVFENDIGSAASTRRLRQKPTLSYQKNWLIPVSGSGVTSSTDHQPSTSSRKILTLSGRNQTFTEQPPRSESKVPPISSKSSKMASRILQELDTIVSPPKERPSVLKLANVREKAPAMMSPSKLQGQALKSLEHIDSSKFLEFSNKQDGAVGTSQQNSTDATSEKKASDQNGLSNTFSGSDKLSPPVNSLDRRAVQKDSLSIERSGAYNLTNSLVNPPMQKKRTFKMSAHEDYVDMEDDSHCNGVAAPKLDGKAKQNTSVPDHALRLDQATVVEKPSSLFDGTPAISGVKESASKDVNAGQVVADKPVEFSFSNAIASGNPSSSVKTQSTLTVEKSALPKESNSAFPDISFGSKVSSLKDKDALKSPFGFVANNGSAASNANEAEAKPKQSASSLDSKPQNLTSFASAGASPFLFGTKAQEAAKAEDSTASKDGVAKGAPEPSLSTSTASFSFGIAPAANSSNGSNASSPVTHFPVTFGGSTINAVPPTNIVAAAPSTTPNAAQSTPAAPAFKFGLPTTPASAAPFTSSVAPSTSFSTNVNGSSVKAPMFGLNAATATTSSAQESVSTGAANGPSAQVSDSPANKTGIAALTQSVPVQFGTGTSAASSAASSNSIFGSSSAAKLFPSASSFGSSSAASSVATASSLLGSTAPVFGGSPFNAPPGGGFSFGGSTSSAATGSSTSSATTGSSTLSISAPTIGSTGTTLSAAPTGTFLFGSTGSSSSSTGAASTFGLMTGSAAGTSPFGSMGTSTTSTVAPIFGLNGTSSSASTGALAFGSSATSSASTAPSSVFGFTSGSAFPFTSAAPKASSSPAFGFGATAAPGTSSSTPAFQFGAATPSNNMSPQPSFPSSNSVFGFGSSTPATNGSNNNDQMNMEDTMAEDSFQQASASLSPAPVFGQQQPISQSPVGFSFAASGGANPNPFQFATQQQTTQNPSPFQASGSLDFNAGGGGSFSLGTGGGDKSARRMVKVRKQQRRK